MIQALDKPLFRTWILILLTGLPRFGLAEEPKTYSLNKCLQIGLRNNLELEIQKLEVKKAKENFKASKAVYDPQLGFVVNYEDSELPSQSSFLQGRSKTFLGLGTLSRTFSSGTAIAPAAAISCTASLPGGPLSASESGTCHA